MPQPSPRPIRKRRPIVFSALLLALLGLAGFFASRDFLSMRTEEPIYPAAGLTVRRPLSFYFPPLAGTPGDTDVFVFEGREKGGRVLILGGTHPNEPAGFISAVTLIENLRVDRGAVIIIPRANASGFTHSDPHEASPQRYSLETPSGRRSFRLGSRVTNPVHQWPDPTIYVNPGGQALAGVEARNLNRAYPGRPRGNLTERTAFAVMELIRREKIDLGIDLHESAPEYPVINALVFHETAADLAALAQISLQDQGLDFRLEASPPNLRGLSHREWGDAAGIMAVLLETPNASHGRLKGRPSASLVVDGRDRFYVRAAELGRLFVPFGPEGIPLNDRVARHLAGVAALLAGLADLEPDKAVVAEGIPAAADIRARGVGASLHGPAARRP
ncbi:MAG: succinylglutamate desuccinylase [Candidatus Aminicenantes bacterium]|nr:succinylglutamate desuccinylase [Candidatus Aminicenantes bacterium]